MKRIDLNALLSFLVILRFGAIRNLLSDLSLSEFPVVRRVKSILKSLLLEAKKRHLKHSSCPNSSTESQYRVKRFVPVISKSNSSPQRTLQSFGVLVYQCKLRDYILDSGSSVTCNRRILFTSKEKIPSPMLKGFLKSAEVLIFFPRKILHCFWRSNHDLIYHRRRILWLTPDVKPFQRLEYSLRR